MSLGLVDGRVVALDLRRQPGQMDSAEGTSHGNVRHAINAGLKFRAQVVIAKVDKVNLCKLA